MFVSSLTTLGRVDAAKSVEMLVLMNGSGKVERYDLASGNHLGTLVSGLPPSNAILIDVDGRLLISTGLPSARKQSGLQRCASGDGQQQDRRLFQSLLSHDGGL